MSTFICSLCQKSCCGYGNNPAPLITTSGAKCCDKCNKVVVYIRINVCRSGAGKLNRRTWISYIRANRPELDRIYHMF